MTTPTSAASGPPEPIAMIGAGCRFAGGVDSPDAFWQMLVEERDGIGPVPDGRWAAYRDLGPEHTAALRRVTSRGGFLTDVTGFDAAFFGLSPREAELMDPQQRLLLEVAWEALEHAGIPPRALAGGDTGVFVGIGSDDYGRRLLEDLPGIEAWTGIGAAMCAAANRISYALDLHGPSMAVDTACSASLVAVHLACQSLRERESGLALVGGVNLILGPSLTITLDAAGATAPDGRSKPFSDDADGYGRGEGAGVVVLKRLSDAQREGDRVLAVIRGGAVRQDGRTNGIMAPNGEAQRDLLTEACRRAGVEPATIGYVEAHGTGTKAGDPLEARALGTVYGRNRPADAPCLVGSVKSTIGHLEAGAGIASLIKTALILDRGEIPATLHHGTPNPAIDWTGTGLRVVTGRTPWPGDRRHPRRAGVSGFGYGGTIAHVLLEQGPPAPAQDRSGTRAGERVYPLSAHSDAALRAYADRLADWLDGRGERVPLESVGHTLAVCRTHLDRRAAVVARDRDGLVAGLRLVARGEQAQTAVSGAVVPGPGPVWVFGGHGAQWAGMGRELLDADPAFAAVIAELEPIFAEEIGFSPREALLTGTLDTVDRIQTLLFAVQVGLAASWRAAGAEPSAVIGHSVGEIAAAVTAGAVSLADGARLICRRSVLLREAAGAGAMAMVDLPFDEVAAALEDREDVVAAIAASPSSTVFSGTPAAVEEVSTAWAAQDRIVHRVASDVAFHSAQMEPLARRLAVVAGVEPVAPRVPMYSTALPDPRADARLDGSYWAANLRNPVRLAAAVRAAAEDGHRLFVEVSAHPVVSHSVRETLADMGVEDSFVGASTRRDRPETTTLLAAVAAMHCHGGDVDWQRMQNTGELVTLPLPAWQRQDYWHASSPAAAGTGRHDLDGHTVLGAPTTVAGRALRLWHTELTGETRPYPGRHTIDDVEIVPAAVMAATFLAAGNTPGLRDVELRLPLVAAERREIQVAADESGMRLASRTSDGDWLIHATAQAWNPPAPGRPVEVPPVGSLEPADPAEVRRHLGDVGVPTMAFDWTVTRLWRGRGRLRAWVTVPPQGVEDWAPALDAMLSVAPLAYPGDPVLRMVRGCAGLRLSGTGPRTLVVDVQVDGDELTVRLGDGDGTALGEVTGLRYSAVGDGRSPRLAAALLHQVAWQPAPAMSDSGTRRTVVLLGGGPMVAARLRTLLSAVGGRLRLAAVPEELTGLTADTDVLVLPEIGAEVDPEKMPDAASRSAWLLTEAAQRLAAAEEPPRLWSVTVGVRESADATALAQAPLWGLGRVIAAEQPQVWGGTVDLPAADPLEAIDTLLDVVWAAPADDVVAIRDDVTVARLVAAAAPADQPPLLCRPGGTYVVTGGLGALGLAVAGHLTDRGARRLVLVSRRRFPARGDWPGHTDGDVARVVAGIRDLEARGATVRVISADVADEQQLAAALHPDALGMPAVRGVVHAAGVLDNRMLTSVDESSLQTVLRPKVAGAWALHRVFPPDTLDFLVLFSSAGHLLRMPGQATYGAANAFLDALAAHRAPAGDTFSLAWSSWRGQGMAANAVVDRELAARGVTDLSAEEAFAAWDQAAALGPGHYPVLGVSTGTGVRESVPLLAGLGAEPVGTGTSGPEAGDDLRLAELPVAERRAVVLTEALRVVAEEMRSPVDALDTHRSLIEQGLDSVLTVVVRRRLERRFDLSLPATLLWNQPNVAAIADHIAGRFGDE